MKGGGEGEEDDREKERGRGLVRGRWWCGWGREVIVDDRLAGR